MNDSPLLVGIDYGSTNIKAVVYEPDGTAVAQASAPAITHYPRPGWAYYKPDELWGQAVQVLRAAIARVNDPRRIAGVATASVGEAAVPIDAHGDPTYDAIAWFDRRTVEQAEWLDRTIGRDALFAVTGLALHPIFGLCKILWLKEHEPEAYARTVRWLNVADYFAFRLCGVPATDYTLASRTLAFDLRRRRWDEGIMDAAGVPLAIFAPAVPSGTRVGTVTPEASRETGLPVGVTVAAGGQDHVCGALPVGVTEPGTLLNSIGTAEALFLVLDEPLADPAVGHQGYTQGAHVVPDRTYVYAGQYTSGACIEWIRDICGERGDYATLIAEAEQVPAGSLGVVFVPHLRLANPPHVDPKARGVFIGLSTDVKRGALFRAVLEGITYESRNSLEPLLAYTGLPAAGEMGGMVMIGGVARNPLLLRIKASVMNRPLIVAEVDEAVALGAAALAGLGAGVYADVPDVLRSLRFKRTPVAPDPDDVAFYETVFRRVYQHLYHALRPLHHELADIADISR